MIGAIVAAAGLLVAPLTVLLAGHLINRAMDRTGI